MKFTFGVFLILLSILINESLSQSTYRIAVVEHAPVYKFGFVNRTEALSIMMANMDVYQNEIEEASQNKAQIIVFPEDGLYGSDFFTKDQILPYLEPIPDINNNPTPVYPYQDPFLNITSPVLWRGSYLAYKYNIYLVFDMGEVKYCNLSTDSNCPSDGRYQYNTLVAFDNTGRLLAKYHKSHLYYEPQFDQPPVPDVVYFDTSFGVRFGMMICFDAMFDEPQYSLWFKHNVRDFTYSTWWVNMPPMITGTQMQQARSLFFPGNFLASGIGESWYTSGSGIYAFGEYLQTWYNPTGTPADKVLIADIPIITTIDSSPLIYVAEGQPTYSGVEVQTYSTVVPTANQQYSLQTTSTYLTCEASFTVLENQDNLVIGLVAITGEYNTLFPAEICALMICSTLSDCTSAVLNTTMVLSEWEVSGSFSDYRKIVYPMFATDYAQIVSNENFIVSEDYKTLQSVEDFSYSFLNAAIFSVLKPHPK